MMLRHIVLASYVVVDREGRKQQGLKSKIVCNDRTHACATAQGLHKAGWEADAKYSVYIHQVGWIEVYTLSELSGIAEDISHVLEEMTRPSAVAAE